MQEKPKHAEKKEEQTEPKKKVHVAFALQGLTQPSSIY